MARANSLEERNDVRSAYWRALADCCANATSTSPARSTNQARCIRWRGCNADFRSSMIARQEVRSSLGRKYGMELSADTVESITRIRDDYEVLRTRVLGDPPFRGCDVSELIAD